MQTRDGQVQARPEAHAPVVFVQAGDLGEVGHSIATVGETTRRLRLATTDRRCGQDAENEESMLKATVMRYLTEPIARMRTSN